MIQSLYIVTEARGEPVLQKHWRGVVHRGAVDLFWSEVQKAGSPQDVLPVIATPKYYIVSISKHGLFYVTTVQMEFPPLMVIEFLHRMVDIFDEYFSETTEGVVKDNFVTIFQLLDELVDNGFPFTTEPNILKEMIPPPGLVSRVLQAVTGSSTLSGVLPAGSLSNIPWRKSGVVHRTNEIFFDIMEEVDAILDSAGNVVSSEVNGDIMVNSKLSGMPDLTFAFANASLIDDCSFHPCVRYARYQKDKVLSFVPPDGQFKLMTYRVSQNTVVPVVCRPVISFSGTSANVNVTVSARPNIGKQVEDVVLMMQLPKATIATSLSANLGTVDFDMVSKRVKWTIGKILVTGKPPQLTGGVQLAITEDNLAGAVQITLGFKIPMFLASGLRVDSLQLINEKYKMFKAMRSVTKAGKFQVRT